MNAQLFHRSHLISNDDKTLTGFQQTAKRREWTCHASLSAFVIHIIKSKICNFLLPLNNHDRLFVLALQDVAFVDDLILGIKNPCAASKR